MGYYSEIAGGYNELYKNEQLEKIKIIKKHINASGLLLDIGAGTCFASEEFKNIKYFALDPSFKMMSNYKGIKIIGKAEKLPFKNSFFDTIISITSLHHTNLKRSLKEIKRVAKPNAKIALTFLKKSKNIPLKLKGFKKISSEKDFIFVKN